MKERAILHVDMDAFYASVEQYDRPELRGLPVIVGGNGPRGVVAAASYEVRKFGVHSAMPGREAMRRCPEAICVAPRMKRYQEVSKKVFDVFRRYTPLVQGLSLDEAYLDVSDALSLFGDVETIGRHIKADIKEETGLTASVGVGPNKLCAKVASDLDKPDGFFRITTANATAVLDPLPVRTIGGIGPRSGARLEQAGIHTLRQLRRAPEGRLRAIFGRYAQRMQLRAAGIDDRPVETDLPDKSISAEETYDEDTADFTWLCARLMTMVEKVAARTRRKSLHAGVINIKVRRADFTTFTRQRRLSPPTADTDLLYEQCRALLRLWMDEHPDAKVRLLGAGVAGLVPGDQLGLFDDDPLAAPGIIDETVDRIRERFGEGVVRRGNTLR